MMNRDETIKSIKDSLKKLFSTEQKFADYTTTDGMKIKCDGDKIEVGVGVQGVDEQGNLTPLNNGVYTLTDGNTINVVDGKVESISESAETEDEGETEMEKVGKEITPSTDNKVEEMAKKVAVMESQLAECLSMIEKMSKGQNRMNDVLMSEIDEIKKAPAAHSIKTDKKGFSGFNETFSNQMRKNEIEDLRKIISERNKSNNNLAL